MLNNAPLMTLPYSLTPLAAAVHYTPVTLSTLIEDYCADEEISISSRDFVFVNTVLYVAIIFFASNPASLRPDVASVTQVGHCD